MNENLMFSYTFLIFSAGVAIGLIASMFVDSLYPVAESMVEYEDMAKRRKKKQPQFEMVETTSTNQNNSMATATKVDTIVTFDDGTTASFSSAPGTPPVSPSETEVDVLMSDGSTRKFVPAA